MMHIPARCQLPRQTFYVIERQNFVVRKRKIRGKKNANDRLDVKVMPARDFVYEALLITIDQSLFVGRR